MRPIDADALIDSLNIRSVTYNYIINKCIEDAPTIEPKTGKWVEVEKNEYEGFSIVNMRCNQCGKYAYLVLPKGTKCVYDYCPWCKADMRGENK